jgi:hypothetical protein
MRSTYLLLATSLLTAPALASPPESATTNQVQTQILTNHIPDMGILTYTGPEQGFWKEYGHNMLDDGDAIIGDRIGYITSFRRSIRTARMGYSVHERTAHEGGYAVAGLMGDEFRDTFVEELPWEKWESILGDKISSVLGNLVENSIGNTSEERLDILSPYSSKEAVIANGLWRDGNRYASTPKVGYRLLRTKPYLYTEYGVGRQTGGLPIAYFDIRGYSDLESFDRTGQLKVEGRMVIPFDHLCQIAFGISGYPLESGTRRQSWARIIKADFPLKQGIFTLSFKSTERESLFLSQFNVSF